jgi:hypothetical protein
LTAVTFCPAAGLLIVTPSSCEYSSDESVLTFSIALPEGLMSQTVLVSVVTAKVASVS